MSKWSVIIILKFGAVMYRFPSSRQEINVQDSKDTPKAVCFVDTSPDRLLHYTSKILEAPFARPILLVRPGFLGSEDQMLLQIIKATGQAHTNYFGMAPLHFHRYDQRGHEEAFALCKSVVVSDSQLCSDQVDRALGPALINFYRKGGTVVVDCVEGVYAIGETLSRMFGCSWSLSKVDDYDVVPTDKGRELLKEFAQPTISLRKAHMMTVGEDEALYLPKPISRTEYFEDYFGAPHLLEYGEEPDLDSIDDPEWLEEYRSALESWERHCSAASTGAAFAVHQAEPAPHCAAGGRLVWIGDRAQEDTRSRTVLAQLLCNL